MKTSMHHLQSSRFKFGVSTFLQNLYQNLATASKNEMRSRFSASKITKYLLGTSKRSSYVQIGGAKLWPWNVSIVSKKIACIPFPCITPSDIPGTSRVWEEQKETFVEKVFQVSRPSSWNVKFIHLSTWPGLDTIMAAISTAKRISFLQIDVRLLKDRELH